MLTKVKEGSEAQKREIKEKEKDIEGEKGKDYGRPNVEGKEDEVKNRANSERRRKSRERVWMSYGKTKIEEVWWLWDEKKEVLMGGKGNVREKRIRGKEKGGVDRGNVDEREDRGREGEESKRGKKGRDKKNKVETKWKIGFWNVAGLGNKDKNFWRSLEEWQVIVLMETWIEKKRVEKNKEEISKRI